MKYLKIISYSHIIDFVQPSGYLGFTHWTARLVLFGVVQKFRHTESGEKEKEILENITILVPSPN